jgi:hypothetical protein
VHTRVHSPHTERTLPTRVRPRIHSQPKLWKFPHTEVFYRLTGTDRADASTGTAHHPLISRSERRARINASKKAATAAPLAA